jgi:hypothetical protein
VKTLPITQAEFQEFCDLQQKHRWDWPAVFSANASGEIWAFRTYGHTPTAEKENLRKCSKLLDWVADVYSVKRDECGRFFIDERGAFFKPNKGEPIQFIVWESLAARPRMTQTAGFVMPSFDQLERDRLETVRENRAKRGRN